MDVPQDLACVRATLATAETMLVAAAGSWHIDEAVPAWAIAVVASKFLAASAPHSLGIYWDEAAWPAAHAQARLAETMAGFAAVFAPRDLRVPRRDGFGAPSGTRPLRYREVMAADIVFHVGESNELVAPRAGSHLVWIAATPPPLVPESSPSTAMFAGVQHGTPSCQEAVDTPFAAAWLRLSDIIAGRIDGRQLDEITVTWIRTRATQ